MGEIIEENDINRTADLLKELHGEGARTIGQERAEGLKKAGDVDGHFLWVRIVSAIDGLPTMDAKADH